MLCVLCLEIWIPSPFSLSLPSGVQYRAEGISWVKGSVCFVLKFALPPFSFPLPTGVQISKQNKHGTFDPIINFTPVTVIILIPMIHPVTMRVFNNRIWKRGRGWRQCSGEWGRKGSFSSLVENSTGAFLTIWCKVTGMWYYFILHSCRTLFWITKSILY